MLALNKNKISKPKFMKLKKCIKITKMIDYCLNKILIDSQFTKLYLNCRYQDSIFYKIKIM